MTLTKQIVLDSGTNAMLHFPSWHSADASGLRLVLAAHGHGGEDVQISQGFAFGGHPEYWADKGYVVGAVSTGDAWLNSTAMTKITELYNYLLGLNPISPKVALLGWSMGGGHCLRWLRENPTLVATGFLCSPMTDLDSYHSDATYTAEIDAAYSNNYAVNGSPRSPLNNATAYRNGPRILISTATNDTVVSYAQTQAFISAVGDDSFTLRQPDVLGGHQGGLMQVPPRETWEWIRTHWS